MIQIINNLDSNLLFNLSKTFANQKKHVNKRLLPAVKLAKNPSMKDVYDSELSNIIRQVHKSCREILKKRQQEQLKDHVKWQHISSRRDQVIYFV